MRKFSALFFILSLLLGAASPARAQQSLALAHLYPLEISSFPTVTGFLDVFDEKGIFVTGLQPPSISVVEDGQSLPLDTLNEIAVPLQLVIAVNQGAPLDTRDPATNFSHFQRISQVMVEWAQSRPADLPDDYSLVSQAGPVINHASAAEFVVGLNGFQPDFRSAVPNLQSLSIALDTVSAQTTRLGMKRAILFITPPMESGDIVATLEPYIQRAVENNIRIFVWYVGPATSFTSTSAAAFNNLALQTGGGMFTYSGLERFPDPELYFSGLRRVYTFAYTSRLQSAGEHSAGVSVNLPSGVMSTDAQKFNLNIEPPNAFPIDSSLQITRRAPEDDPFNPEALLPAEQQIEIIVEFPDGYERPLARTTLYVDGEIVDENTTEPFNLFTWNLEEYASSGEHQISVEAVDMLGLGKTSLPSPVMVTVIQPPQGIPALLAKYRFPIMIGGIALAGLALLAILLSGRLRMPSIRAAQAAKRAEADPLTQSVAAAVEQPTIPLPASTAVRTQRIPTRAKKVTAELRLRAADAPAALLRIHADGQIMPVPPIALMEQEIVFGTDPTQCSQILDDPSISPVHARLRVTEDGGFLLIDGNSTAGTWVNYDLIPREGHRLAHGDMVNFGQAMYRFTLRTLPAIPKPTIITQTLDQ
jgi:hypothetical protein